MGFPGRGKLRGFLRTKFHVKLYPKYKQLLVPYVLCVYSSLEFEGTGNPTFVSYRQASSVSIGTLIMVNSVGMCIVRLTMGNPIAWHIIYIITQEIQCATLVTHSYHVIHPPSLELEVFQCTLLSTIKPIHYCNLRHGPLMINAMGW